MLRTLSRFAARRATVRGQSSQRNAVLSGPRGVRDDGPAVRSNMATAGDRILEALKDLPEDASCDEAIERLVFLATSPARTTLFPASLFVPIDVPAKAAPAFREAAPAR